MEFVATCEQTWGAGSNQEAAESSLHSRGFTIYGALLRMGLLPKLQSVCNNASEAAADAHLQPVSTSNESPGTDGNGDRWPSNLALHVLGADGREGNNPLESSQVFGWLCQQLHRHGVTELSLLLIGPHICPAMHNTRHSGLLGGPGSAHLTIEYSTDLYHERLGHEWTASDASHLSPCTAAFCFNAGVWGYDSWIPTIAAACRPASPLVLVITSYNLHEAADDRDTPGGRGGGGQAALRGGGEGGSSEVAVGARGEPFPLEGKQGELNGPWESPC